MIGNATKTMNIGFILFNSTAAINPFRAAEMRRVVPRCPKFKKHEKLSHSEALYGVITDSTTCRHETLALIVGKIHMSISASVDISNHFLFFPC